MPASVFLDAGPLGLACMPPAVAEAARCRAWLDGLQAAGVAVYVPGIADYEVRRELARMGSRAGLGALDDLGRRFVYLPVTRAALARAAEFWGLVRNAGMPTADRHALDGDAILAGQATTAVGPGEAAVIASGNVGHLGRFPGVDARDWDKVR